MPAYTVTNAAGTNVATINIATTTGDAFPVELVGQGISLYGGIIAKDLYRMTEHFAKGTEPINPIEGMIWYNTALDIPFYYDGGAFQQFATATSGSTVLLSKVPEVDFAVTGLTTLFTAPSTTTKYCPTGLLLFPTTSMAATTPAMFNLRGDTDEDVLESNLLDNPDASRHFYYVIEGKVRFFTNGQTISISVTTAATGGALTYDAYLFGFTIV